MDAAELKYDFYNNYKFVKDENSDFIIQSFEQIGMCDPFPNEKLKEF